MAVNVARVYGEHRPDLASKWNLQSADAAITAHEQGDFRASARMVDAMGRSTRIASVTETRIQAVLGLPFQLEPPEESKDAREKQIAEELAKPWARLFNEDTAAEALKWRVHLGFWLGELIWYDERGRLQDDPQRLKVWHPQHSRWDFDRECFMLNTRDGEIPLTHGDGKWIVGGARGPRPWMRGAVRSLWVPWILQEFGWRDLGLYGERTGQGILGVKTAAGVESGERSTLVDRLRQVWRGVIAELPQLGSDGPNHDLDLLETGTDEEVFDLILSKADATFAIRLLGQNLTTEVKGGSFAATKAHDRVRLDYLEADTDSLSSDCRSGAFEPWCERKYGSRDLAPYPHWDAEIAEDMKATAEGQKAFGDAVNAIQSAGFDVENVDEIAAEHGLKLKKRQEPKTPPAVPGQPGQPPGNTNKPAPALGRKVAASQLLLARPHADPGFHQGQEYIDALVANGTQRAAQALANDIAAILTIVRSAQTPGELRAGLAALYVDADPTELGAVLERARMMAELAGKYSVIEDVNTEG